MLSNTKNKIINTNLDEIFNKDIDIIKIKFIIMHPAEINNEGSKNLYLFMRFAEYSFFAIMNKTSMINGAINEIILGSQPAINFDRINSVIQLTSRRIKIINEARAAEDAPALKPSAIPLNTLSCFVK